MCFRRSGTYRLLLPLAFACVLSPQVAGATCYADVPCAGGGVCVQHFQTDPMEPEEPDVSDCQCQPNNTKILDKWTPGADGWLKCSNAKPTPRPCPAPATEVGGACTCPACDSPQMPSNDRCQPGQCTSEGPYADPPCHCYLNEPSAPQPTAPPACYANVPCAGGGVCAQHFQTDPMEPLDPDVGDCECKPSNTKLLDKWTPGADGWLKCTNEKPTPRPCPHPATVVGGACTCPACDSPQMPSNDRCQPGQCTSEGPDADPPCHCYMNGLQNADGQQSFVV